MPNSRQDQESRDQKKSSLDPFDPLAAIVGLLLAFVGAWAKKLAFGQGATLLEIVILFLTGVVMFKIVKDKSTH